MSALVQKLPSTVDGFVIANSKLLDGLESLAMG